MAQIDLFFSEKDLESLVSFAFSHAAVLVPDLRYSAPSYVQLADLAGLRATRPDAKLFFMLHASYLVTPLEMRCTQKQCYIMQRNGGPSIDIFCPGEAERSGAKIIGQGYAGYHPTFWNPTTGSNEKAPPALKKMYALLQEHIRTHAARLSLAKRTFWIGLDAFRLFKLGWQLNGIPTESVPALLRESSHDS